MHHTHLKFNHRAGEARDPVTNGWTATVVAPTCISIVTPCISRPGLARRLLTVQSCDLGNEFCLKMGVEGVAVQRQQDMVEKLLLDSNQRSMLIVAKYSQQGISSDPLWK